MATKKTTKKTAKKPTKSTAGRPYVIVRCTAAGVWAGELVSEDGREIKLANARRCRRFYSAPIGDCTDLALVGLTPGCASVIRPPLAQITLSERCETIVATEAARASIQGWPNG
jgi:hypothetical protein